MSKVIEIGMDDRPLGIGFLVVIWLLLGVALLNNLLGNVVPVCFFKSQIPVWLSVPGILVSVCAIAAALKSNDTRRRLFLLSLPATVVGFCCFFIGMKADIQHIPSASAMLFLWAAMTAIALNGFLAEPQDAN